MAFMHYFNMLNVTGKCYQPAAVRHCRVSLWPVAMHCQVFSLMDQGKLQPVNYPAKIETGYCTNEASMFGAHFSVTFTDT